MILRGVWSLLACSQAGDVVARSDAILEERGIGLGRVAKTKGWEREREGKESCLPEN